MDSAHNQPAVQLAKILVFVLFCGFVLATLVVEVVWTFDKRPDFDRYGWQPGLVYAMLTMIVVQMIIYAIDGRAPKGELRTRGFPVTPKDKP